MLSIYYPISIIYLVYLKKFGFISLSIAPEAPRIASPITTLIIFAFPSFGFPEAHCTPPIIMNMNETIKIAVTTIFESHPTRSQKTVLVVDPDPAFAPSLLIHLPTKGTFVLSFTPPSATQLQYASLPAQPLSTIHLSYFCALAFFSFSVMAAC